MDVFQSREETKPPAAGGTMFPRTPCVALGPFR